jgi:hypothetical protein
LAHSRACLHDGRKADRQRKRRVPSRRRWTPFFPFRREQRCKRGKNGLNLGMILTTLVRPNTGRIAKKAATMPQPSPHFTLHEVRWLILHRLSLASAAPVEDNIPECALPTAAAAEKKKKKILSPNPFSQAFFGLFVLSLIWHLCIGFLEFVRKFALVCYLGSCLGTSLLPVRSLWFSPRRPNRLLASLIRRAAPTISISLKHTGSTLSFFAFL